MQIDPRNDLLSRILTDVVAELRLGADPDKSWAEASRALAAAREDDDIELFCAIDERDGEALGKIVWAWSTGERNLCRADREVLKRALKAFRKRLKIVQLDSESTAARGPTSSGKRSGIIGVAAPDQYPQEVWDELVRQKRLVQGRDGNYELPPV